MHFSLVSYTLLIAPYSGPGRAFRLLSPRIGQQPLLVSEAASLAMTTPRDLRHRKDRKYDYTFNNRQLKSC